MYLLPGIKVSTDGRGGQSQVVPGTSHGCSGIQLPLKGHNAALDLLGIYVQAKGFRLLVAEEPIQLQVLGTEGEELLLKF